MWNMAYPLNVKLGFHPRECGLAYNGLLRPGPAAVFADIIGLAGLFVHAGLFQIKRDVNPDRRAFQTFKVCAYAFGLGHISSSEKVWSCAFRRYLSHVTVWVTYHPCRLKAELQTRFHCFSASPRDMKAPR